MLGQTGLGELGISAGEQRQYRSHGFAEASRTGWDGASDLNCEEQTLRGARIRADSSVISQLIAAATQQDHG